MVYDSLPLHLQITLLHNLSVQNLVILLLPYGSHLSAIHIIVWFMLYTVRPLEQLYNLQTPPYGNYLHCTAVPLPPYSSDNLP